MSLSRITQWIAGLATAGASMLFAVTASAQSCAMCYSSAAAAKGDGIRALQHGIMLLVVPPLLMFVGIFAMAFRSRERFTGSRHAEALPEEASAEDFPVMPKVLETPREDEGPQAP